MSKTLATLSLGLLLVSAVYADKDKEEPVCRVVSVVKKEDANAARLVQKRPGDKDGYPVTVNCTGFIKDHYLTDAATVATLEFLIGGRVSINRDSDVEVVNERSVADGKTPVKRFVLKKGAMMVKADAKSLKQPIEIQTNGGVMGIKGTEFTVETQNDGTSRVCCYESNSEQGGVELRDTSGKVIGTVKPGDEYLTNLKAAPVVKHHDDVQKFRDDNLDSIFGDAAKAIGYLMQGYNFLSSVGAIHTNISPVASRVIGAGSAAYTLSQMDVKKDPWGGAATFNSGLNSAGVNTGPAGSVIGWGNSFGIGGGNNKPSTPDYPFDLAPDAAPESKQARDAKAYPQFSWKATEDVDGYVVILAKDEPLDQIVFSDRVNGTNVAYPNTMRPLTPGKYYWRVIPVDDKDQPVKQATQAYFNVTS